MSKVKKLATAKIRKITGGKDPARLIEEFIVRRGFDPEETLQQRTTDIATWSLPLSEEEELEITLEGLSSKPETTLYMGINVYAVPIRNCGNVIAAALSLADTIIGAKLSLVNYDLVLSVTEYAANINSEEIEYYYELINRQKSGIQEALAEIEEE